MIQPAVCLAAAGGGESLGRLLWIDRRMPLMERRHLERMRPSKNPRPWRLSIFGGGKLDEAVKVRMLLAAAASVAQPKVNEVMSSKVTTGLSGLFQ
jgi:hypothetical protein